jgi:hypothetical protein
MSSQRLPISVQVFVAEHIRNVEELQLLIAIIQSGDRWWDSPAAARELGISTTAARRALDHLAARNLLDIRITGDVRYQFCPGTEELRAAAHATDEAYRVNPLAVARLTAGAARRGIRDFADAFRLRREDDDAR